MADRYTYLPLIGIFIIVAWGGKEIVERWPLMRSVTIGVSVIAGVALMAVSWRQVGHWKTSHTLFRHAADVTERNYFAYNHIGLAFEEENKREEAIPVLKKMVADVEGEATSDTSSRPLMVSR